MKKLFLIPILVLNTLLLYSQKSELKREWLYKDSLNYHNILQVLSDSSLLKKPTLFFDKIIPFYLKSNKDLGFGLTLIKGYQYGGYTTANISALIYDKEIIQLEISYSKDDKKIIQLFAEEKNHINQQTSYINKSKYKKYVAFVSTKLGDTSNILNTNTEYQRNFNFLTNPILSFRYGTICYSGGVEPKGRIAINYFIAKKDSNALREIMKRYNPEGRLYAVDALLKLSNDNIISLTNDDKLLIYKIISSKIPISACIGCLVSNSTANQLIKQKIDLSEEIKIINQENKIRKEQGLQKRVGY